MKKTLNKKVIHKIMDRAVEIDKACGEQCRDFCIMTSEMKKDTLILRWTSIDISDPDFPVQRYNYECFHMDGTPQNCPVEFKDQREANEFSLTLVKHYKQIFCLDHKPKIHVLN